ncbi:MAG: phosphoribosyltransferase [Acidimicrobiales bacterium]
MFLNRSDAGQRLAEYLDRYLGNLHHEDVVVLGLPRGGVPVAFEVAALFDAPLDVILVRKLGVPTQPELGMGAIGEDGVRVINDQIVDMARIRADQLAAVEDRERLELDRRSRTYRAGRPRTPLAGRVALIIDDGIATGSTAKAACQVAKAHGASRVILAVPVAPQGWTSEMDGAADELVTLATPRDFGGIGRFYRDFSQVSDDEVLRCLDKAGAARSMAHPPEA